VHIELAKNNLNVLKNFYQALKGIDKDLKFLFMTGISKFAKTSIFSDLNHLDDITIHPRYSKICGYSQDDLENRFDDYIGEISEYNEISRENLLLAIKE
jgi:hypothetical protein